MNKAEQKTAATAAQSADAATTPDLQNDTAARLEALERAEQAINDAYSTGKAERAKITQSAQLDAAEAVAMAGIAMESDEAADEAMRLTIIAEAQGNREKLREARRKEREARKKARRDHRAATKSAKRAYDAIKFSAPHKLGFMRAVQVIFALHIVFFLLMLILTSRDSYTYNTNSILDWFMIIFEGVAFWFFINRYRHTRALVVGMSLFYLVVENGYALLMHTFNPAVAIANSLFYVFLILYFLLSRRVKNIMINDLSMRKGVDNALLEAPPLKRFSWPFIRNLIIYFIVFSVLGHWMEMAMCQLIIAGLVQGEYDPTNTMLWRDWLYPFPMEGAAVVLIALILYPLKQWLVKKIDNRILPYVISFLANALMCTIIEFGMGLIVNADLQLWNYTDNFCNIMGQVCLQNTLAFGVAASLIAWFVYPLLERWIARVRYDVMNIAFVVVLVFGGIIWSLYIITPPADVDLGGTETTPEEMRDLEISSLTADGLIAQTGVEGMTEDLALSEQLTDEERELIQQTIDEINASLDNYYGGLGVERPDRATDQTVAGVVVTDQQ